MIISVSGVSKKFLLPHERRFTLKEHAVNFFRKNTYEEFYALRDVSFTVAPGEFLGIIGRNGSGKSTLLKLLSGIYRPDQGTIHVDGAVSPFLELGIGFNPELTARENVYLNGVVLGMTRKEIDRRFPDIVAFSELGRFMDQKLKNFSSGMQVRLAFSVAIQAPSDILFVDEVLAVGDAEFQQKCHTVFRDFKQQKRTVIFVSHGLPQVHTFCDRVLLFEQGLIMAEGQPDDVITTYKRLIAGHSLQHTQLSPPLIEHERQLFFEPWYHDFSLLGLRTQQRQELHRRNQICKQGPIFDLIRRGIAICTQSKKNGPVHGVELFCADGFYSNFAVQNGVTTMHGIDIDEYELSKAKLMTKLLGHEGRVTFENRNAFDLSSPYDFGVCAGGLYHVERPEELLRILRRSIRHALVIQTVYSLAKTAPDYFETPAPGWTWGCRFSYSFLLRMVREAGWTIVAEIKNELLGNGRLEDRGSAYLLCIPLQH